MFSEKLLDHFRHPRNVGVLLPPAVTVEVSNPACGDVLRLSALFAGDLVTEVRYQVRGCTASIGAGSALTELIAGKTTAELDNLRVGDVEFAVGELGVASKHVAILCIDAVKALRKATS